MASTPAAMETSQRCAVHSPPSLAMIVCVSCAAARSRSTAKTMAPSRANNTAVALPLLQPGATEPAPATIATLPSNRPIMRSDNAPILRARGLRAGAERSERAVLRLRPLGLRQSPIGRIDRERDAVLPLHDHQWGADPAAFFVEVDAAGSAPHW